MTNPTETDGGHPAEHDLTMEVQDEPRMFRAVCSCGGYVGPWKNTNACMGWGHRHVAAMRRRARAAQLAAAVAVTCLILTGCGSGSSSGSSYGSAADVAKAAGLTGCKPDPQEVGVTDAMSCPGSTEVDWFKSHDAMGIITTGISSSPDTFLVGDQWALECVHRQACIDAQAKIGGDIQ